MRWGSVNEPAAPVALAVVLVVAECLAHLADAADSGEVAVVLDRASQGDLALRIATTTLLLLPDGEPPWLQRCRSRAAVAGGRLLCGRDVGSFLEVRFPAPL